MLASLLTTSWEASEPVIMIADRRSEPSETHLSDLLLDHMIERRRDEDAGHENCDDRMISTRVIDEFFVSRHRSPGHKNFLWGWRVIDSTSIFVRWPPFRRC